MALGDALAVALLDARGFRAEDFARSHPGGSLGRKLLMHVADLMRSGDAVPRVAAGRAIHRDDARDDAARASAPPPSSTRRARVAGHLHRRRPAPPDRDRRRPARPARQRRDARQAPKTIRADALAVEAAELMEQHRITSVLVVDAEGVLVGAINSQRPDAREGHLMAKPRSALPCARFPARAAAGARGTGRSASPRRSSTSTACSPTAACYIGETARPSRRSRSSTARA